MSTPEVVTMPTAAQRFALALIALGVLSAMTLAGPLEAHHWLSGFTALIWAFFIGEGAAVVANGWTVQGVAKATKKPEPT